MSYLVRCSCVLSAVAITASGALLCCNAGWLPSVTMIPLRVAAMASSAAAGLVGWAAFVALDLGGRSRAALVVGGLAAVAGLPAFAVLTHMIFPTD